MTDTATTVARLLALAYNQHVKDHGPDGNGTEPAFETLTGAGFTLQHGGDRYVVLVVPEAQSPLMNGAEGTTP
jgi:hypothetical protein